MGNTGYGSEGTRGKFPVHLHLGIYIEVPFQKELSVNPYWLLKIFEKKSETIHIKLHNLLKVCYNMQEYQSVLRYFPARSDLYGNTVMEKYFMPLPACCQRADSKVRAYDRGA